VLFGSSKRIINFRDDKLRLALRVSSMHQLHPLSPAETLTKMYDLPSKNPDESGLPDRFHEFQSRLLREPCQLTKVEQVFIGVDLNL
jgi:hypothetical protein